MGHTSSNSSDHLDTQKSNHSLSERCRALYDFAVSRYPSKREVETSDDEQEFFTSAGAHYRNAIELTTRMALRAASKQETIQ